MKIGIYVYSDKIRKRGKEGYFDNIKYIGIRRIVSEIAEKYEICYVSHKTINEVDFVLLPIISYRDVYNFLWETKNITIKSRVIAGGPGLTNPFPLFPKVWACVLNRAENLIQQIFNQERLPNVIYRDNIEKIRVGQLSEFIQFTGERSGEMPKHLSEYKERHIGCVKKCYFCQYTWKNIFKKSKSHKGYRSGFNDCENTIAELDWRVKGGGYLVTAIDGLMEQSRKIVNRGNITNAAIEKTLKAFFETEIERRNLKLYCVIAYPFEKILSMQEIIDICKRVDRKSKKHMTIFLQCTHFVPMPLTPMESESVNWLDGRQRLRGRYDGHSIRLILLQHQITSPVSALEQTFINRYRMGDNKYMDILISRRYNKLRGWEKKRVFREIIPEYYYKELNEFPSSQYCYPVYNISAARIAYKKRIEQLLK